MTKYDLVKKFNTEIIKLMPYNQPIDVPPDRIEWFKNVVTEELAEFEAAWNVGDNVGMIDALVDMTYFILGRVFECGIKEHIWDESFAAVHDCNMEKSKGNKGRGSDDDAIKDENWIGPESRIQEIYTRCRTCTLDEYYDNGCTVPSEDDMQEIEPAEKPLEADQGVEHRGPSVYLEEGGEQRILSIDELNLFAKMSPVFSEVTKIAIKKSQDYNNGQGQPTSRAIYFPFGLLSYAQMLHTKSQRLNSLAQQNKAPNNESVRDTLLDMINYATFAVEAIDKGEI